MFKFTIRELLLSTLVVAMGVGWWVDRSRIAARAAAGEAKIGRLQERIYKQMDHIRLVRRMESVPNSSAPASNSPRE